MSRAQFGPMEVSLNRKSDYAIRAVLFVAHQDTGRLVKAREISEAMKVPQKYLAQILAALVRASILEATAGRVGGYKLARPASEINMLEVFRAVETRSEISRCLLRGIPCDSEGFCDVHEVWLRAKDAMSAELEASDFESMVTNGRVDLRIPE